MYIDRIVSGVKIYGQEPDFRQSYLVAEGSPGDAICLIGELHVEAVNAGNLVEWVEPGNKDKYVLLISLDGKEGVIFPKTALEQRWNGEEVYELDYGRHYSGEDLKAIIKDLDLWASKNTDLARDLGYKFNLKKIPKRLNFKVIRQDFAPGHMDREILEWVDSIEQLSDDAIVWWNLIGDARTLSWRQESPEEMRQELQRRIAQRVQFRSTFFPLNHVTLAEVDARAARARSGIERMRRLFPDESVINEQALFEWLGQLDSDTLAEMAVLSYYSIAFGDLRGKALVLALQSRFPG